MRVYFLRILFPIENMIQLYGLKSSANVHVRFCSRSIVALKCTLMSVLRYAVCGLV